MTRNACIEWTKAKDRRGYGKTWFDGRVWLAHRVAWTKDRGPIPDGMLVLHTCDNPACVNVEHLYLGTHADNMRDMVERGGHRGVGGAANRAKTHCPSGHPYDDANTCVGSNGWRTCRACAREKMARRRVR